MWTQFIDMSSNGFEKTNWSTIFIELPEAAAVKYFEDRFDINPYDITCTCCGDDFAVLEMEDPPTPSNDALIISKEDVISKASK